MLYTMHPANSISYTTISFIEYKTNSICGVMHFKIVFDSSLFHSFSVHSSLFSLPIQFTLRSFWVIWKNWITRRRMREREIKNPCMKRLIQCRECNANSYRIYCETLNWIYQSKSFSFTAWKLESNLFFSPRHRKIERDTEYKNERFGVDKKLCTTQRGSEKIKII